MILDQASEWTRQHLLKLQIGVGVLVFLFIAALSLNPPPRVVIQDTRPVPDLSHLEALQTPSFKKLTTMSPMIIKAKQSEPVKPSGSPASDTAPAGWYSPGQCTHHVWTKRPVGKWGNASEWLWQAKRDGFAVSSTPRAGSIAWKPGHVAFVISVSGNKMTISEANYDWRGSVRTITIPISNYKMFIY